jgi:valyl-tRNA synthetase
LERLRAEGWLAGTEAHRHAVGHCQRCGKVVEPLVSLQWFVRMAPLARAALAAVREGHTRFVPERFGKVYENWLENIRDWCISRQIWWGHRIPVWYCASCGQTIASRREVAACPHCEGAARQDEDVLDTWFSSALWPFSTLGWPQDTAELKYFYPTSVLVTGYDIIFFWVARMMFMGMEFKQAAPFRHVFIHGLVRDDKGRKMSKSLGNGIDPLEVVEKYGADSLRFTLVNGNAPGNDMRFYWEKAEASRNFANKIWNAARFVLLNLDDGAVSESAPATLADRWIVSRLERTARELTFSLERYELGEAARLIYEFIWNEFCDWYIELAKPRLYNKEDAAARARARRTLAATLEKALRLLHPFMPFISEELWQALPHQGQSVMAAPWPAGDLSLADAGAEAQMNSLMEVVKAVRNLRAEMNVAPGKKSAVILRAADSEMCALLSDNAGYIRTLAAAETVDVALSGADKPPDAAAAVVAGVEVYLPLKGLLDLDKEIERLNKEQDNLEKEIARLTAKLDNPGFTAKAPPSVVAKEQEKRREYESKLAAVSERVRYLAVLR